MARKITGPTNTAPGGGRYAHLLRLVDELCTVRIAGKWTEGIIRGLWTDNDGSPQCVVVTADCRLKCVGLGEVRFPDAAERINVAKAKAKAKEAAEANDHRRAYAMEASRARAAKAPKQGRQRRGDDNDDDYGPSSLC